MTENFNSAKQNKTYQCFLKLYLNQNFFTHRSEDIELMEVNLFISEYKYINLYIFCV